MIGLSLSLVKCFAGGLRIPDGLIHWWKGSTKDKVGDKDLTLVGDSSFSGVGPISDSLVMDGTGDYATFNELSLVGDWSLAFWVKGQNITEFLFGNTTNGENYVITRSGYLETRFANSAKNFAGVEFPEDRFYHVVIKRVGLLRLVYVDGLRNYTTNNDGTGTVLLNCIGVTMGNSAYSWTGEFDDIRFYSKALSDDEVISLFEEAGSDIAENKTLEIAGSVTDLSGNGNDATINGNASFSSLKGPVSSSALYIDGSAGSYLNVAGADFQWSGATHHRVSMWVRALDNVDVLGLIGNYVSDTQGWKASIEGALVTVRHGGTNSRERSTFYSNNAMWNKLDFSFDSLSLSTFFNAVNYGGDAGLLNAVASNTDLFIGAVSSTGDLFNGYIDGIKIYDRIYTTTEIEDEYDQEITELADNKVVCYGDSLTAGTGSTFGNSFPAVLQDALTTKIVFNHGSGGDSASAMVDRFVARAPDHNGFLILWNDYSVGTKEQFDRAIASCTSGQYIVLSCTNFGYGTETLDAENAALSAAYGDNYLDVYAAMQAETGQPEFDDFRSDSVHLNDAGYTFVAGLIADKIAQLGALQITFEGNTGIYEGNNMVYLPTI